MRMVLGLGVRNGPLPECTEAPVSERESEKRGLSIIR